MASGFPGSIDNFTDPLSNSSLSSPSHAGQHADLNDAVEKIETYMGLVKVATFTATAQTTLSCDNVFTSLYLNYRVIIQMQGISNGNTLSLRYIDSAGATVTTSYFSTAYGQDFTAASTTFQVAGDSTRAVLCWLANGSKSFVTYDISSPNTTTVTTGMGQHMGINSGSWYAGGQCFGYNTLSSSMRGFTLLNGVGSNMTGTCTVYGYRN